MASAEEPSQLTPAKWPPDNGPYVKQGGHDNVLSLFDAIEVAICLGPPATAPKPKPPQRVRYQALLVDLGWMGCWGHHGYRTYGARFLGLNWTELCQGFGGYLSFIKVLYIPRLAYQLSSSQRCYSPGLMPPRFLRTPAARLRQPNNVNNSNSHSYTTPARTTAPPPTTNIASAANHVMMTWWVIMSWSRRQD